MSLKVELEDIRRLQLDVNMKPLIMAVGAPEALLQTCRRCAALFVTNTQ